MKYAQYTTKEMMEIYGQPNQNGTYLASASIPFKLKLAWDTGTTVTKIRCHKIEVLRVEKIFSEILEHYGQEKISALQIDHFGGCFNFRQMRGGNDWSKHSWGCAIDLDPSRNQLHENSSTARFAKPEYKAMIDIFEANGWGSLGRLRNYDWMHFEPMRMV